jgi:glycosyltransferase involved in cell wall biosynthesis
METNIKPQVSIQMCTFNRAHYIPQSIESVLTQTFTNWELLILDDASTDNTKDVVSKYLNDPRIKYIKNEDNLGIARNRNKGLDLSIGEYIAVLDSDDYWIDNTKLEKQIKFLENNPEYTLVGTNIIIIDETGKELNKTNFKNSYLDIKNVLLLQNQIAQSTVLYRKNSVLELGGYSDKYMVCDDYDLWLNIAGKFKIRNLPDFTTKYLEHSHGISKEKKLKAAIEHKNIVNKYKRKYPNYILALIKAYVRILTSVKI